MSGVKTIQDYKNRYVEKEGYRVNINEMGQLQGVLDLSLRPNDVFVASYPKSGTTWLQEIVWLVCNEADTEKARKETLEERFPYVEYSKLNLQRVAAKPGQRFIKTHFPIELLPKAVEEVKPKILYVARNPKDTMVSYFHFIKMLEEFSFGGTLQELCTALVEDQIGYGPWWKHILGYWLRRDEPNFLFLTYEEMKKEPVTAVRKIAKFLGKDLTEQQVSVITENTSFSKMKDNKATNYSWMNDSGERRQDATTVFMRKGTVGDWQNHMTEEMGRAIDKVVEERLHPHGLRFEDSL